MKAKDLIEALEVADRMFQKKHGKPLEIFDMTFNEDGYDGDIHIQGVAKVEYDSEAFGYGQKRGLKPHADFRIHFYFEDGEIADRSVTFEDAP